MQTLGRCAEGVLQELLNVDLAGITSLISLRASDGNVLEFGYLVGDLLDAFLICKGTQGVETETTELLHEVTAPGKVGTGLFIRYVLGFYRALGTHVRVKGGF